ncbi:hypothetical protein FF38_03250 [Lucilia cuprina]|uniref:Uncharacterized protein n=1 Tax=Lucilia cuprina TaxID=7375 RepID=A0A0L0BNZ4_LUCCU|nr:hypothetical protein FF38_03250 [Lucilia cuprina]
MLKLKNIKKISCYLDICFQVLLKNVSRNLILSEISLLRKSLKTTSTQAISEDFVTDKSTNSWANTTPSTQSRANAKETSKSLLTRLFSQLIKAGDVVVDDDADVVDVVGVAVAVDMGCVCDTLVCVVMVVVVDVVGEVCKGFKSNFSSPSAKIVVVVVVVIGIVFSCSVPEISLMKSKEDGGTGISGSAGISSDLGDSSVRVSNTTISLASSGL